MKASWRCVVALSVAPVAAVCGSDGGPSVEVTRTDSAGIEVVTIHGRLTDLPEWASVDDRTVVRGDQAPFLGSIGEVGWLSDDRFAVEDAQGNSLQLFSSTGQYVRELAGRGDGPGEIRNIATITVGVGDSLYVFDLNLARTSVLDPDAGLVRTAPVVQREGDPLVYEAWALGPDRRLVYQIGYDPSGLSGPYPRKNQNDAILSVRDGAGRVRSGPVHFPGDFSADVERGDATAPFSNRPFIVAARDQVVYGSGLAYELNVASAALELRRVIRWPDLAEPISDQEVDSARNVYLDAGTPVLKMLAASTMTPNLLPSRRPAMGPVLLDDSGRFWVSRFEPRVWGPTLHSEWHVLDATGRPLGRLSIPARSRLIAVRGDQLLLAEADSLDVESLHLARLRN